ncbi:MAG TPA: UvrD-helicase domain-containing protein, partial [Candidatus Kryptonia bacterium]|nr:UvrD-helicase domain-containing protein [Candidatus Kryptonia bacterium]
PDHAARTRAITDLDHNLVVDAGAGTGKTTVLIDRIVQLIATGRAELRRVVAITFTEKAAGELKLRLRNVLEERLAVGNDAGERLRTALEQLDRAHVATIHAFCAALLRECPAEAGVDPGFDVLDQLGAFVLRHQVWDRWFASEMTTGPAVLARALAARVSPAALRDAAMYLVENRDLLALLPKPVPADAAAFVAALQERTAELRGMQRDCVDATDAGCRQIEELAVACATLAQADATELESLIPQLSIRATAGNQKNWRPRERLAEVKRVLRELRDAHDAATTALRHNLCVAVVAWLGGFLRAYDDAKRQRSALDFSDLLLRTRDLLAHNRFVRGQLQRRFQALLVDEFQDTDPLQLEIVFFLAERTTRAAAWHEVELAPGKLFLVGDPKQSIYRFRRADIELYDSATRAIMRDGAPLDLRTNFRSRRSLVEWVNRCFSRLIRRPDGAAYQPDYVALAPPPDLPEDSAPAVCVLPVPIADESTSAERLRVEARAVAECVAELLRAAQVRAREGGLRPLTYRDIGILFRDNEPMQVYEDELRDRALPYRVAGGKRFYGRDEVAALTALLRAVANPKDQVNLVAALRGPFFGFSDEQLYLFASAGGKLDYLRAADERVTASDGRARFATAFEVLRELHRRSVTLSPAQLLATLFDETHVPALLYLRPHGDQRVANLLKLIDIARALEREGVRTLRGLTRFLADLERLQAEESESPIAEETDDVVRLMTIHKAKGLEFPVVILAGGGRGESSRAPVALVDRAGGTIALSFGGCQTNNWEALKAWEKPRSHAEAVRLLYVAATRARDCLVVPQYPAEARGTFLGSLLDVSAENVRVIDTTAHDVSPRTSSAFRLPTELSDLPADHAGARSWADERATLLARATGVPHVRSVSSIAAHDRVASQPALAIGHHDGAQVGTLVHAILQRIDISNPDSIESLASGFATGTALDEPAIRGACALVRRGLTLPVLARARSAGRLEREVPFVWVVAGEILEGVVDLVFRERGRLVIVDYKTDDVGTGRSLAERVAAYRPQAVLYAAALQAITGEPVQEVVLAFLRSGVEKHLRGDWPVEAERLVSRSFAGGARF